MMQRRLHEFCVLILAAASLSRSLCILSPPRVASRVHLLCRVVVVGFVSIATQAASFVPHQTQSVSSSSQSSFNIPIEKKVATASATCLEASTSSSSSSFTEKKDDDDDDDVSSSSSSCANNDKSRLITGSTSSSSGHSSKMSRNGLTKTDISNYHLIWSPGAFKKMAITTFCLLVLPRFIPQSWKGGAAAAATTVLAGTAAVASSTRSSILHCHAASTTAAASGAATTFLSFWGRNFVLPLAASSCCLLQLSLNLVSFGCAGWNTVLGPFRPYFLSILLYTFIMQQRPFVPALLTSRVWQVFVALLPEMVHLYNKYYSPSSNNHLKTQQSPQSVVVENELLHQVDVEFDIPTMGCVACIKTINHALRQQSHVISASSELKPFGTKGGQAIIRLGVKSPNDVADQIQALIQAVEMTGFDGATATSVRTSSQKKLLERVSDNNDSSFT